MKRSIIGSLVCILMAGMIFSSMADARTYKIATVAWAGWAPANVADVKGFWEAEGVDVNVFTTANPLEVAQLFEKGLVDIAFDMIGSVIGMYMEGLPVTIIAETNWSHGGDKIIVKQELDVTTLPGKPIGVYFNQPSVTYFLNQYLTTLGVKLADINIVEMEPDTLADHFIAGRFSIIACYDPEALRAEREGNGKLVATSATYKGSIPEGMMVLTENLKSIPQEDLVKILKGWKKAVEWTQDPANWPEYMEILNAQTFEQDAPYSEEDLREMVQSVRIHDAEMLLQRNKADGELYTYLQNLKTFLDTNSLLKKDFQAEVIFDNSAIIKALETP